MNTSLELEAAWHQSILMNAVNETVEGGGGGVQFEVLQADAYSVLNEILAIITAAIAFSGVFVNYLNIRTFIKMGINDGVSVTFLTLSVSDFCYTFVTFIQSISRILSEMEMRYDLWFRIDPFAITFFSANVGVLIYIVSMLTTTYLATIRCLCVAKPLQFKNMFTRGTSFIVVTVFLIIAVATYTPVFAHMGMVGKFDPKVNATKQVLWLSKDRQRIKDIVRVITDSYMPLLSQIIVVICVIVMTRALVKSTRFRQKQTADRTSGLGVKDGTPKGLVGKELTIVIQVVAISIIYIVCSISKMFSGLFSSLEPKFDMGMPLQYVYLLVSDIRTAFDCINSSVNFYVYIIFNTKFRQLCFNRPGK